MKKLILSLTVLLGMMTAASAQDYDFTAGVRAGYGAAFSVEASAQMFFNDINRLEVDFGARLRRTTAEYYYSPGMTLTGIYQWHWFLVGGLGAYGGPALQMSLPEMHHFCLGLGVQVGIDYQFDLPFQLSVDFRPLFNPFGPYRWQGKNGFDLNVGIGMRYAF